MSIKDYISGEHSLEEIENYHEEAYAHFEEQNEKYNFIVNFAPHEHDKDISTKKLKGLIFTVKDCFTTKGIPTTAGSKILENYVPPFDATIVRRIKEAGGFVIGKTAMDEFGFGSFSINYFKGPVKNALNPEYVAGGSSGGSAVATALAKFPHVSIAESTGGSVSNPAAFNGVFSITPTYGLLSRYGLIDYASSLDKPGIMGRSVEDLAIVLDVIAGKDERDSTSLDKPVESYEKEVRNESAYKLAYIENYVNVSSDEVKHAFFKVVDFLNAEGYKVEPITLKYQDEALAAYYIIATAEASTNLAKYCGMRYGQEGDVENKGYDEYFSEIRSRYLGKESKRRILLGTFARMSGYRDAYYLKAQKIRTLVIEEFKKYFSQFDLLLAPTMPILPIKIEDAEKLSPHEVYAMDILTVGVNLASFPHINVPIKANGTFPAGLHVIANHLEEHKGLGFAYWLERNYPGIWKAQ